MRFWRRDKTATSTEDTPAEGPRKKRPWILIAIGVFVAIGGVEAIIVLIGWAVVKFLH